MIQAKKHKNQKQTNHPPTQSLWHHRPTFKKAVFAGKDESLSHMHLGPKIAYQASRFLEHETTISIFRYCARLLTTSGSECVD